jgi:hypothetical protein
MHAPLPSTAYPCATSEPASLFTGQAPNYPTYRPTLGQYRNEHDLLPEAPLAPLDDSAPPAVPQVSVPTKIRRIRLLVNLEPVPYQTLPDSFGQFRVYPTKPDSIPDIGCELADVCDI